MAKELTDEEKKKAADAALVLQVKSLTDSIALLAKNQEGLQNNVNTIASSIKTISDNVGKPPAAKPNDDDEDDDDIDDKTLENVDRKEFMNVILSSLDKKLQKFSKDVEEKIGGVKQRIDTNDTKTELEKVMAEHKDFADWAPEIKKIISESPGINLKRAYKLAREENPDKVKEIDEKYKDSTNDDKGKRKTGFGGLTPTSGSSTDKPTDMKQEDAAESAWADTMDGIDLEGNG